MAEREVTSCEDCPAHYFTKYMASFCNAAERSMLSVHDTSTDDPRWNDPGPPPDWCPLRQGPVVLKLKGSE